MTHWFQHNTENKGLVPHCVFGAFGHLGVLGTGAESVCVSVKVCVLASVKGCVCVSVKVCVSR